MIRLVIPTGLERNGPHEYVGKATAPARGEPAPTLAHECNDDDAVELEWGDGTCIIQRANDLAERLDASSPSEIDLALASSHRLTTTRDGAFASLIKIAIHSEPAKTTARLALAKFDEARLRAGQPLPGGRKAVTALWSIDERGEPRPKRSAPVKNRRRRVLLLVHGTFSNTRESFAGLFASHGWPAIFERYDDVLGFDHPTTSVDPVENAKKLVRMMPKRADVDVLSYSRGGLVADLFAAACQKTDTKATSDALDDALAELRDAATGKELEVRVSVRVGAPVRGTTLMAKRLDTWLNVFLNVVGLTLQGVLGPAREIYDALKTLVIEIVRLRDDERVAPGLAVMAPTSTLVRWLPAQSARDKLVVIAGDASRSDFLGRLRTLFVDLYFQQKNDLVVDTAAMVGGVDRTEVVVRAFRDTPDAPLHHLSYFSNREVQLAIADALFPTADDQARQSPSALRDWQIALDATVGDGATAPPPLQPSPDAAVIVVPGIMGTMLAANGSVVWPRASEIAKGRFAELTFQNGGPTELLAGPYHRLLEFLARDFRPVTFPYDWRASIEDSAKRLAERIDAELKTSRRVHVVAHSLGGLVLLGVRAFQPRVWKKWTEKENRAVFLGTPFRGSWSIVELLTGDARLVRLLALADLHHSKDELLAILRRFPAVLELLPADNDTPTNAAESLFDSKLWQETLRLDAARLHRASVVRAKLDAALRAIADEPYFSNLFYVAGRGRSPTLCGGSPSAPLAFRTNEGDGTVTWRAPLASKLSAWLLEAEHGDLADTPSRFDALSDLLVKGTTTALRPLHEAQARRDMGAPVSAPIAIPALPSEEPDVVPTDRELGDAAIGRSSLEATRALRIEVRHGDLAKERDLVVVGHASGEALRGAEPSLDIVFRGLLSERLRAGRYPGVLGTSIVIPRPDGHAPSSPMTNIADPRAKREDDTSRSKGVLVIGLGNINDLTRAKLRDAFQSALIELSLPPASSVIPDEVARKLAVSLVGYRPYGGLDVTESVSACLDAVLLANRALAARGLGARGVDRVRFVDVYAQVAEEVTHICQKYSESPGIEVVQEEPIVPPRMLQRRTLNDWLPLRSVRARPSGRFRRITIDADEGSTHATITFGVAGDGALSDRRKIEVSWATIDRACEELLARAAFPARAASALRAHVLPLPLHEEWTSGRDLQLVVDRHTARIPWELFLSAGVDEAEPLTSSVSVLRQLQTMQAPTPRPSRGEGHALVVQAPGEGAPPLRGAAREADEVQKLLSRNGFRVESARAENEIRPAMTGRYEIVHIAGHGKFVRDEPSLTGAVIRFPPKEDILSIFDLRSFEAAPPAVVFLSCCHLGRTDPGLSLTEPGSFAAGLAADLIRQGVQVVVAAGWAVDDEIARVFASVFYEELLAGQPLRLALANARVRARERDRSLATWAAYQVYGLPDFVLPSVRARASNVDLDIETLLTSASIVSDQEALDALGEVLRRLDLEGPVPVALRTLPRRFVSSLPRELQTKAVRARLANIERTISDRTSAAASPPPPQKAFDLDVSDPNLATAKKAFEDYVKTTSRHTPQEVAALWLTAFKSGLRPDIQIQARRWLWRQLYALRAKKNEKKAYRELVVALQAASTDILDDPNAGGFQFDPKTPNGITLKAEVTKQHSLYAVTVKVVRTNVAPAGPALLYLHPSFGPPRAVSIKREREQELTTVLSYGSFTVGLVLYDMENKATMAELDLYDAKLVGVNRERFLDDGIR